MNSSEFSSDDIPSLGYPIGEKVTNNQSKITLTKRAWAVWIYRLVRKVVSESPPIEELKKICDRQDKVINRLDKELKISQNHINALENKLVTLSEQLKTTDAKSSEYRKWEEQIRQHISSVDQKAISIEQLRSLIYAIWDVTIQTVEPDVEKAELLVKSYKHLIDLGPEKRSKVDKNDLNKYFGKRWTEKDI